MKLKNKLCINQMCRINRFSVQKKNRNKTKKTSRISRFSIQKKNGNKTKKQAVYQPDV